MKATGIVRRVDDLGRIVIPKEIRRTLRIREGDSPLIYAPNSLIPSGVSAVADGDVVAVGQAQSGLILAQVLGEAGAAHGGHGVVLAPVLIDPVQRPGGGGAL